MATRRKTAEKQEPETKRSPNTFDREELLSVLADASPALAKSGQIEGFKHFWFDGKYVFAYDGGLGVRLPLETELECGVPGRALLELLKTSALKEVFLDMVKDDLVLQMGKSKMPLVTADWETFFGSNDPSTEGLWSFPDLPPKKSEGLVLSEAIVEGLNQVSFVRMSKGEQPMHHGVTVIPTKGAIELYSSDSRSMAQSIVKEKPPAGLERFIMPWGFIERILSLVEPGAELHVLKDCLLVQTDAVYICSNLLEVQEKPDLAKSANSHLTDDDPVELPTTLQQVLDRAKILAGGDEAYVTFTTKGNTLTVSGKYGLGSLDEKFTLKSTAPEATAKFRADIVSRGLANVDAFTLAKKALVLFGGESFMYVVAAAAGAKS